MPKSPTKYCNKCDIPCIEFESGNVICKNCRRRLNPNEYYYEGKKLPTAIQIPKKVEVPNNKKKIIFCINCEKETSHDYMDGIYKCKRCGKILTETRFIIYCGKCNKRTSQKLVRSRICKCECGTINSIPVNSRPIIELRNVGKVRILFVVDQYGWAFENIARGIKKYSKHDVDITSYFDIDFYKGKIVNPEEFLEKYDIVINMCHADLIRAENWRKAILERKNKYIVANWGHDLLHINDEVVKSADGMIFQDRIILKEAKQHFNVPMFLIPEGIDTEFFKPIKRQNDKFVVGWAGKYYRPNKRTHLLGKLKYPIKIQSNWGKEFFVKNRDQKEMLDFYNGLDVYIYVSNIEGGQSTTILEAMACGLPVVATNAGSEMRNLLSKEWLLPINPEKEVVRLMNEKLDILKDNLELRQKIGKENRNKIMNRSWKYQTNKFDKMIESIFPKVSVMITNYNYGKYIEEAIESVLYQTYPNLEIIVVDDGSTDNSLEILQNYEGKIKLIVHGKNHGYQRAMNTAIANSSGKFLTFLDSDDSLHPKFVETLVEQLIVNPEWMAIYPQMTYVDEDMQKIYKGGNPFPEDDITKLLSGSYNCGNMMMFRRECLRFMKLKSNQWRDERLSCQGDVEWMVRFLKYAKVHFENKYLYYRRVHQNKSWKMNRKKVLEQLIKQLTRSSKK